jgi:hypothetical protein
VLTADAKPEEQGHAASAGAIVYYVNETPAEALSSPNYSAALHILSRRSAQTAREIREALLADVNDAPVLFVRDLDALSRAARLFVVDLFVFSNELSLNSEFMVLGHKDGILTKEPFDTRILSQEKLLAFSPLSTVANLRNALDLVVNHYAGAASEIALIIRSHASSGMILMPRVNFDFSSADEQIVLEALEGVSHDDLRLPDVILQGTTQRDFWNALKKLSDDRPVSFPLVFLSACESGPHTWEEALAIPWSVGSIAHSGLHGLSFKLVDYGTMFDRAAPLEFGIHSFIHTLTSGLSRANAQQVYIDSPLTAWRWPLWADIRSLPEFLFALPFVLWLFWVGSITILKSRYRKAHSANSR